MRLVFLSRWLPYPPSNGSKLRIFNLLKQLSARGYEIHLLTFYEDGDAINEAIPNLKEFCSEVECIPYKPYRPTSLKALAGFFSFRPRSLVATYQPQMAIHLKAILNAHLADLVLASQLDMANYGLLATKYKVPCFLEELEIGAIHQFNGDIKLRTRLRNKLTWVKYSKYIGYLGQHYKGISVVSESEKELIEPFAHNTPLHVLPNGVDVAAYQFRAYNATTRKKQLIFNGALTFNRNYEAVAYFLSEVFPKIRGREGDIELFVTGKNSGVNLQELSSTLKGVTFTGFLDDIQPLMVESAVCVASILSGGGTRLKILEAFALGTPVVSTSKGAEGLDVVNGTHLLIADNPSDFVTAVSTLLHTPELAASLALNARKLVEEKYCWNLIAENLDRILKELAF
ncbi:glycosyltransferase family 4 protein [Candidatus Chlorohelix sp.]|uniref:glycosyltransferase family 4 protein n=1 Tax=Candidatus Chlorohelix sp. TaxID=3139201 RepID=UPI0030608508